MVKMTLSIIESKLPHLYTTCPHESQISLQTRKFYNIYIFKNNKHPKWSFVRTIERLIQKFDEMRLWFVKSSGLEIFFFFFGKIIASEPNDTKITLKPYKVKGYHICSTTAHEFKI